MLLGVIFLFVIHGYINIEPSIIALSGAGILMIVVKSRPEHVLRQVDWSTLIFFAGLFIIISGAVKAGAIDLLSTIVLQISGGNPWLLFFMIIWILHSKCIYGQYSICCYDDSSHICHLQYRIGKLQCLEVLPSILYGGHYHLELDLEEGKYINRFKCWNM